MRDKPRWILSSAFIYYVYMGQGFSLGWGVCNGWVEPRRGGWVEPPEPPLPPRPKTPKFGVFFLPRSAEFWFFCSRAFARVRPDFFLFWSPSPTPKGCLGPRSKVAKWDFCVWLARFTAVFYARARSFLLSTICFSITLLCISVFVFSACGTLARNGEFQKVRIPAGERIPGVPSRLWNSFAGGFWA